MTPFQQWLASSNWAKSNPDAVEMARTAWNEAAKESASTCWANFGTTGWIPVQEAIATVDAIKALAEPPSK